MVAAFCIASLTLWLYWPTGLEFRSDDWLAIAWSQSFEHVVHDFVGPYQGAERIALFHRPLITASVFVDTRIAQRAPNGEILPFLPHLQNLVVHLANTALVIVMLRRFVSRAMALAAGLWWATLPGHVEAVSWMIGRVDTHGAFFILLTLYFELRRHDEARGAGRLLRWRALSLASFVLAVWTKELAFVTPGLVFLLGLMGTRSLSFACRSVAPFLLVLAVLLGQRLLVLGESVGGYAEAVLDPWQAFEVMKTLVPRGLPWGYRSLVLAVALGAFVGSLTRVRRPGARLRLVAFGLAAALLSALPTAGAAGDAGSRDERYQYLPSAGLAACLAAAGPLAPLALFAGNLPQALHDRWALREVCAELRAKRAQLAIELARHEGEVVLFDCTAASRGFRSFHVGVDRLGYEPFSKAEKLVLPARAIFPGVAAQRDRATSGDAALSYEGPLLDRHGFEALRAGGQASLVLRTAAAERVAYLRVSLLGCFGWLRSTLAVSPDGATQSRIVLAVKDLLLAPADGCGDAKNVLQMLWPQVEIGIDSRPRVQVEALDASRQVIDGSRDFATLPITRELGHLLREKNARLWVIVATLAAGLVLSVIGRRS